jgi:hypothetical protein
MHYTVRTARYKRPRLYDCLHGPWWWKVNNLFVHRFDRIAYCGWVHVYSAKSVNRIETVKKQKRLSCMADFMQNSKLLQNVTPIRPASKPCRHCVTCLATAVILLSITPNWECLRTFHFCWPHIVCSVFQLPEAVRSSEKILSRKCKNDNTLFFHRADTIITLRPQTSYVHRSDSQWRHYDVMSDTHSAGVCLLLRPILYKSAHLYLCIVTTRTIKPLHTRTSTMTTMRLVSKGILIRIFRRAVNRAKVVLSGRI